MFFLSRLRSLVQNSYVTDNDKMDGGVGRNTVSTQITDHRALDGVSLGIARDRDRTVLGHCSAMLGGDTMQGSP